jgi:hypothetical protein
VSTGPPDTWYVRAPETDGGRSTSVMPDPLWSGRNDASPAKNGHHVRGVTGQGRLSRAASQRPQAIRLLRFRLWGSNVEDDHPTPLASPRNATCAWCFGEPVVLPHQTLEAALADAAVAPDPSTTWRRRIVTRRRAESATRKMAGKPALCPSFPSCKKGLKGRTRSEHSPLDTEF